MLLSLVHASQPRPVSHNRPRPPLLVMKNRRPPTGPRSVILAFGPLPELEGNYNSALSLARRILPAFLTLSSLARHRRVVPASTIARYYRSGFSFVNQGDGVILCEPARPSAMREAMPHRDMPEDAPAAGAMSCSYRQLCPRYWSGRIRSSGAHARPASRQKIFTSTPASGTQRSKKSPAETTGRAGHAYHCSYSYA